MAKTKMSASAILKALDWAYDKSVKGLPGTGSAEELGAAYLKGDGSLKSRVDSLIRWQNTKAATSGFVNGLPGVLAMPVTVPASLSVAWYIQLRMVAAIAHMGGYEIRDDKVQTLAYVCLCGNGAKDVLKDIGTAFGRKMTQQAIKSISGETIVKINRAVGFRLVTKFGEKGIFNLGKAVPLVGGVIGAMSDGFTTNAIGNFARTTFISE